jgi:hypothetical protein
VGVGNLLVLLKSEDVDICRTSTKALANLAAQGTPPSYTALGFSSHRAHRKFNTDVLYFLRMNDSKWVWTLLLETA